MNRIAYNETGCIEDAGGEARPIKARLAENPIERFLGLMGQKDVEKDAALVFPRCSSIHCFWMRFPIDVLWLGNPDDRGRCDVLGFVRGMKPWRLGFGPSGCWGVAEMRAESFASAPIRLTVDALNKQPSGQVGK